LFRKILFLRGHQPLELVGADELQLEHRVAHFLAGSGGKLLTGQAELLLGDQFIMERDATENGIFLDVRHATVSVAFTHKEA
jgi:hypothetical protein